MAVIRAILCSFMFHFLVIVGLIWLAPKLQLPEPEVIEVTLSDEQKIFNALKPKDRSVVRQAVVPEKMKLPEDETLARFLSEQKQRVKEETQAAKSGMTQNRSNRESAVNKPESAPPKVAEQKKQQHNTEDVDKDGYRNVDISKELAEMKRYNDGFSSVGESLPTDVKVGSFTALNTDRYLFYTFYARVEELIRYRWETRVQQAIDQFDRIDRINAGNRNWVTQAEFILDRNGNLRSALIMKSSGIKNFDMAAVNAFKEARIFPNPPQEMLKEDGYIHLVFSFTVRYSPPALVNRN
ncbi:energy transducer TonB family protein [Bdellovibrio bacteriovorus]|uniref:Energy transducer TonB n=1 Tax=Bdellovibrio bacteriovorus TaxID=959 RepID=A0A1Z3NBC4_BDEBC|nr:energy transducer TonB [Bdellovibrio bacteriovorus]ASD64721.1 energy transducer TonB [Bdellovibrio bacteriovorus]